MRIQVRSTASKEVVKEIFTLAELLEFLSGDATGEEYQKRMIVERVICLGIKTVARSYNGAWEAEVINNEHISL